MLQFQCRHCGAANIVAKKSITPQNSTFTCRNCGTRNQLSVVSAPQPPVANANVPVPPPAPPAFSAPPASRANIRSNVPVPPISPIIVPTPSRRRKSGLGLAFCFTFLALIVVGAGGAALWFAFGSSTFLSSSSESSPFVEFVDPKTKALARFYADVEAAEQTYVLDLNFQRLLIPDNVSADNVAAYIKQFNKTAADANCLSQALNRIDLNSPQYAAVPRDVKTAFGAYRSSLQELAQFLNANVITQEEFDKARQNVAASQFIGGLAGFLFDAALSQDEYVYDEYDNRYYVTHSEPSTIGTEIGAHLGLSAGLQNVRSQFNALVSQKAEPLAQACVVKWNEFYQACESL